MSQVKELADQVISAVKTYVSQSFVALSARLDELDGVIKSLPAPIKGDPGEPGEPGIPGKDAEVTDEQVAKSVANYLERNPIPVPLKGDPGEPGEPGKDAEVTDEQLALAVKAYLAENPIPVPQDGKSVTAEDVLPQLHAELTKALESLPKPVDGKDGRNAFEVAVSLGFEGDVYAWQESLRGEPGKDGKSVTADEVLPELKADLQKAIESLPIPKDGEPGKDGKGVTIDDFRTMFEAESTKALLDFERRAQDVLQKSIDNAIDRIPKPKDGVDGIGFDDLEVVHDGERQITLKFVRGDVVKEFPIIVPALIDRGVYRQGQSYAKGDCVSYGGSIWIAQKDTETKPESDDSWRLSVKRGRDGKDGSPGKKGEPGLPGRNGRDLTQIGHDGAKW